MLDANRMELRNDFALSAWSEVNPSYGGRDRVVPVLLYTVQLSISALKSSLM